MPPRQPHPSSASSAIRARNLSAVLLILLRSGYSSRSRLAQLTGLSATTITNLVTELMAQGIVEDVTDLGSLPQRDTRRRVGRPRTALRLIPEARYAVGVHIGIGSVYVTLTDLLARPLDVHRLTYNVDDPPEAVLEAVAAQVDAVITQSGIDPALIIGVGVGASGLVDPQQGVNVLAPNLGWHDVPLQSWLSARLGMPVSVDNNVRAMALGEALFGAGQDVYSLAFVYARVGVGAGIVVDGRLYYGGGAGAGEIGHMTIIPDGGEQCRCGNTGCLETLIAEPVIVRLAEQIAAAQPGGLLAQHLRGDEGTPLERVFRAAEGGDVAVRAMLEERAHYMGIALANLVDILNPDLIVLGGLFAQAEGLLLPAVEHTMRAVAFADLGEHVRLETSRFGRQAGSIGAAALALNAFFYRQGQAG